jgi:hypothetical protein
MMTKLLTAGAFAAVMTAGAAGAATVTATASTGVVAGYGTNTGSASWADAPETVVGSIGGQYKSPVGDGTTAYFTLGTPSLPASASPAILNVGSRSFFSMLWGSIDVENAVLFSNGVVTALYTGEFIRTLLDPDGAPGETNAIVSFNLDFNFTTVSFFANYTLGEMSPTGPDRAAFEFQVAPVPVPVPAAGFLLIGALGGLAALRRRKTA